MAKKKALVETLQVTVTDHNDVLWTGSLDAFMRDNAEAVQPEDIIALFAEGTVTFGGGAAPLLTVTLR